MFKKVFCNILVVSLGCCNSASQIDRWVTDKGNKHWFWLVLDKSGPEMSDFIKSIGS